MNNTADFSKQCKSVAAPSTPVLSNLNAGQQDGFT
ncbi:MAG: hypothetical protein ACJAUZ_001411, partial [Flavobacteriaceae bacterium]